MYGAVTRGDRVSMSNYQTAVDVSDNLISDLHTITINGNGLGKFEGTPSTSAWWITPSRGGKAHTDPNPAQGAKPSGDVGANHGKF